MRIKQAIFVKSSDHISACPSPQKAEFAFIGRSNVGKSSLINMLLGTKKLAKTSSTPGKTQLINHFLVNNLWYLVDLPGYGWAKTSKENKRTWEKMIRSYLLNRENLVCVFVLVDVRITMQEIDRDFINWMGEQSLPFILIFTKTDKLSKNKVQGAMSKYRHELLKSWEETPPMMASSSVDGSGREKILDYISNVLDEIPM